MTDDTLCLVRAIFDDVSKSPRCATRTTALANIEALQRQLEHEAEQAALGVRKLEAACRSWVSAMRAWAQR